MQNQRLFSITEEITICAAMEFVIFGLVMKSNDSSLSKSGKLGIKILISILLIWALVTGAKLDFSLLTQLMVHPIKSLICVGLFFLMIVINAKRWFILNEAQNIQLSFTFTTFLMYLGTTCNNLLPGGAGGDFYRFYLLRKEHGLSRSKLLLSILFDRITGLAGVFIMLLGAFLFAFRHFAYQQEKSLLFLLLLSLTSLVLFFIFLFTKGLHYAAPLVQRIPLGEKVKSALEKLFEGLVIYKNHKKAMFECVILSLLIQFICVLITILIGQMLNFPPLPIFAYVIAFMVTTVANLIPVTPGGLGIGELAFANVFVMITSMDVPFATIYLAYRILGYITYLPGALFCLVRLAPKMQAQYQKS